MDLADLEALIRQFKVHLDAPPAKRFNIAPSQACPVVRVSGAQRELVSLRWGLIPSWAKSQDIGVRNINARAESVAQKPTFRRAFERRRCLIPASGFYEWQAVAGTRTKQPHYVQPVDQRFFAFAGIWERWREKDTVIESFAILTTVADPRIAEIHPRMPVILDPQVYTQWLDEETPTSVLQELLPPHPASELRAYPVSDLVNAPDNDDHRCIAPLEGPLPKQTKLF